MRVILKSVHPSRRDRTKKSLPTLPQSRVRHRLHDLDNLTLRDTEQRLRANQERNIRNSIQYTMAVLFNCITEGESDLVVDPYLNSLGGP